MPLAQTGRYRWRIPANSWVTRVRHLRRQHEEAYTARLAAGRSTGHLVFVAGTVLFRIAHAMIGRRPSNLAQSSHCRHPTERQGEQQGKHDPQKAHWDSERDASKCSPPLPPSRRARSQGRQIANWTNWIFLGKSGRIERAKISRANRRKARKTCAK